MKCRLLSPRTRLIAAAAGLLVVPGSALAWSALATGMGQPQPPSISPQTETSFSVLTAADSDPLRRAEAAERLLGAARDPLIAQRLIDVLRSEAQPQDARHALLAAVARAWAPPARLYQSIAQLAGGPTSAPPSLLFAAIAAYRTPDAVLLLVKQLNLRNADAVRTAAADALIAITGREDLGQDRLAWMRWFNQHRGLDPVRWRDALAEGVWRRDLRLTAERMNVGVKLTDASRRLYLALPAEGPERPRYLAQLLGDATVELRTLGLDIVAREISAGKAVDPVVVQAVAQLLQSPDPAARARSAVLSAQLAPGDITERVAQALQTETNPAVAANLLIAAARWPSKEVLEPALSWLEESPEDMPAAIDALVALRAVKHFENPALHERAARVLRELDLGSLTPAGCRLLADIGSDQDRVHIAGLLRSDAPQLRTAAAEALAADSAFCDEILEAAASDPRLFPLAVRATIAARPTAEGFASLSALPAESQEIRSDGLLLLSLQLPLPALVQVAESLSESPELREELLSPLTMPTVDLQPAPGTTSLLRTRALLLLAETRLALGRPERALSALETMPEPLPEGADTGQIRRLLAVALLWTNQIDRAAELNESPDTWMDALEYALQEEHAPDLLEEIRRKFEPLLTEAQLERLRGLAARLELIDRPRVHR